MENVLFTLWNYSHLPTQFPPLTVSPIPRPLLYSPRTMPMMKTIRWRWGLLVALAMMLLSLFPQFYLWYQRGSQWNGSQAIFYTDEAAYAAYINALIDGRPRRNDPYSGRDDNPAAPLPESLFSIQFIPAYLVALPAKALGLSTATAFILITPIVAFAGSLALFWLLVLLTNEDRMSAALVPLVLCSGLLVSGNGVVRPLLGFQSTLVYLPFLRRYNPAVAFPCFLLFFALVWQALMHPSRQRRKYYVLGAAGAFIVCLYGYFFLWTAALAWLALVGCLWFVARPDDWRNGLLRVALLTAILFAVSVPYMILLSRRAPTMDVAQIFGANPQARHLACYRSDFADHCSGSYCRDFASPSLRTR